MPDQFEYDVALSFLVHDLEVARALYRRLSETLKVFFYERRQEELTGRDGLEGFREPFLCARVSVVLYRPPYGEAGWTGVERVAIGEACQKCAYDNLFVVRMDPKAPLPTWVPKTHIYFNMEQLPFDELVGAIKLKVAERGGKIEPMTPEKRAAQHVAEKEYLSDLQRFRTTSDGLDAMRREIGVMFEAINGKVAEFAAKGIKMRSASTPGRLVITNETVSVVAYWKRSGYPTIEKDEFVVEDYEWYIATPSEPPRMYFEGDPTPCATTGYLPELTHARQTVWKEKSGGSLISSTSLADKIVTRFFALDERVVEKRIRERLR